jgi:hypothetical protein
MIHPRQLVVVLGVALVACSGQPVGRLCDLGSNVPDPSESIISSPSLDCVSRECLKVPLTNPDLPMGAMYPEGTNGLCTASCEQDSDCSRVPESPCVTGFTCGIAVTQGPFCCEKVCICKDYVQIPSTGVLPTPIGCDASDSGNGCCNLPGRAGNTAQYPLCTN